MRKIFPIVAISIVFCACSNSKNEVELAKDHLLDSVNAANNVNRVIDSMNALVNSNGTGIESQSMTVNPATGEQVSNPSVPMTNQTSSGNTQGANQSGNSGTNNEVVGTQSNGGTSASTGTTAAAKKKMSNTTKGALIGAGAGVVAGAITGAATSKDKGKGAVIGGLIGGAVGSGVGYGAGAAKDKKAAETKTTTP